MSTFVLAHGAFHGGWCWRRLVPLLRAGGHPVYTPTLTGLGERAHLAGPEVGLETHIADVSAVLEFEDLTDAVLVGHSYSGMVIAGVADRAPERIKRLVYLDAFVPEDGQSLADIKGGDWLESVRKRASEAGGGWRLAPPSSRYFDVLDEADIAWADARLTAQPIRTFEEPVRLKNRKREAIPCAYIACMAQEDNFEWVLERVRARGWECFELAAGHDAMITATEELAGILLSLA
ncbi:MAG: alpha/beta hydrolase [Planctomycetota bacterium]|jgi:pimeloyl-ACP methyl ester carboxylesterase